MATVKLTSSSGSLTQDNTDNFHDVSFSSYLNSTKEIVASKLAESDPCLSKKNSTLEEHHHKVETKKEEDGEIGVFSAEKYFKGVMDDNSPRLINSKIARKYLPKKAEENDPVAPVSTKFHPGAPSVISESSWNSQSALLQSVGKNSLQRKTSKAQARSLLAVLGCKCSDKESVEVHDQHAGTGLKKSLNTDVGPEKTITQKQVKTDLDPEQKSLSGCWIGEDTHCKNSYKSGNGLNKESYVSTPTSNSNSVTGNLPIKQHQEIGEIKQRKSLEVFGSQRFQKRDIPSSLEKRLTMLSLDAIPRMEEIDVSAAVGGVYNDNESDASSDLFEIDSLTGKINTFLAMQGSDATSAGCRTPTTCYAPSEVSIDWSVVTASAADFSAVSDYEERRPSTTLSSPIRVFPAGIRTCNETPRRRLPSSLLGCKSEKAVRVAGDAHGTNGNKPNFDQRLSRVSDSYMSLTRFPYEGKLTAGYDSRSRQRQLASRNSHPRQY